MYADETYPQNYSVYYLLMLYTVFYNAVMYCVYPCDHAEIDSI